MSELAKRTVAAIVSVLVWVGLVAFTTWGFDPASWSQEGRFWFAFGGLFFALSTLSCPIWSD